MTFFLTLQFQVNFPLPFNMISSSPDHYALFACTECGVFNKDLAGCKSKSSDLDMILENFLPQCTVTSSLNFMHLNATTHRFRWLTWRDADSRLTIWLWWTNGIANSVELSNLNRSLISKKKNKEEKSNNWQLANIIHYKKPQILFTPTFLAHCHHLNHHSHNICQFREELLPLPFKIVSSSPDHLALFSCTECGFFNKDLAISI
jgi:hypothetical protein